MSQPELLLGLDRKVDPRHASVVCIDMQKDFICENLYNHARGGDVTAGQQMAPRLLRFLDVARGYDVPVIHVRANYDPLDKNEPMRERDLRLGLRPCCETGSVGFEWYEGFGPRKDEVLITKHRNDAFHGTELDLILQGRGMRTIILGGVATSGCVDSTARAAYFQGYYVVFLSDGTAAARPHWHQTTLEIMEAQFAEVRTMAEVEAAWARIAGNGADAVAATSGLAGATPSTG